MATTLVRIQQRRKTAAAWTSSAEVLLPGELGIETDTLKVKIGDGVTAWAALAYHGATDTGALQKTNNLSDLTAVVTARANLGLGSAATHAATDFATAGASDPNALQKASNLSDLASASTARTNLGLKSGATTAITVSTSAPASPATNDVWIDVS